MKIEMGKKYTDKVSGEEATVVGFRYTGDKIFVEHKYYGGANSYEIDSDQFKREFKEKLSAESLKISNKGILFHSSNIEVTNVKKKNVNQDILKLIEAGYEFSSFWGDTVDGRSINVDLNEEEVK